MNQVPGEASTLLEDKWGQHQRRELENCIQGNTGSVIRGRAEVTRSKTEEFY